MADTTVTRGSRSEQAHAPVGTSRRGGFVRSVTFSAVRGAALIGLAVVIGIVLLQVVDDGTSGPVSNGDSGSSGGGGETTTTTDSTGESTTTTAPTEIRPPQEVRVLALNGSGVAGAASTLTDSIRAAGYQTEPAADAPENREGTIIYYTPGYEREAAALVTVVGGDPAPGYEALPDPSPIGTLGDSANLIVVIGS